MYFLPTHFYVYSAERYWRKTGLLPYHSFIRDFYNESTAKNRILYFY